MISILLDIKNTGDWNQALKHVPRRKLVKENSVGKLELAKDNLFGKRKGTKYAMQFNIPPRPSQSISDSLHLRHHKQTNYKENWKNKQLLALRDVINE